MTQKEVKFHNARRDINPVNRIGPSTLNAVVAVTKALL